ncbi:hypothetical protein [Mycobacterium genavense]|uniref:hypothetical protein n=1 Tax=Mycobacterium genavense TaxID=36812 RepID=UPI001FE21D13|nr:hypothetical protein [Mycobacterium genavense]
MSSHLVIRSKRFLSTRAAGYDLNAVCEQQGDNVSELVEFFDAQPVGQFAQHLDIPVVLTKADAHGLALQLFELAAADAVHAGVGLAEEADRVVHELGHRPRRRTRHRAMVSI